MKAPAQPSLLEHSPSRDEHHDSDHGDGYDRALERAGRWLALRARTEQELRERLADGGFDPDVIDRALTRLQELGLVDDADFARSWVAERAGRKDYGPVLLARELRDKGIAEDLIAAAVTEAFPDEAAQATEVAGTLVRRWVELPLPKQASRLASALARKGFSQEAVEEAVKAVLPPEGWD